MFQSFIVQPIFNLLVLIYALLPGHNFGLALVIFTIVIRLLMWPLIKKQLHHAKAMRRLQPELKRIKKEAKGDRQKESMMVMELYKEREVSPFGSLGVLAIQLVILLGLYSGLQKVVKNPHAVIEFSYPYLQNLGWLKSLAENIGQFDATFLGFIDLTKAAIPSGGGIYWPAMFLVAGSAVTQYFQAVQLMPTEKDARTLRQILKDAGSGKKSDQGEVNAAVGRSTRFFIPVMIFVFTINLPSALGLYWFVSGLVAYLQQYIILRQDEEELEAIADQPDKSNKKKIIEGEVVSKKPVRPVQQTQGKPKTKNKKSSSKSAKKRRR
ncbi:MAG TPA: YidC/Oxa1 family membrane protein insertase [Candidatus Limnocylindria bacterium]|nr:YidC/Oxa1 family membrane protein insertase [Candidatus Limnocylindria bacterium]